MEKKGEAERTKKNGDILMKTLTNKQTTIWWNAKLEPIKKTKRQEGGKKRRRKKNTSLSVPIFTETPWNFVSHCNRRKWCNEGENINIKDRAYLLKTKLFEVKKYSVQQRQATTAVVLSGSSTAELASSHLPICCMCAASTRCNNCVRQSPANRSRSVRHRAAARGP